MEKIKSREKAQFPISVLKDGRVSTGPGSSGTIPALKNELIRHVSTYGSEVTVIIRPDKEVELKVIEEDQRYIKFLREYMVK